MNIKEQERIHWPLRGSSDDTNDEDGGTEGNQVGEGEGDGEDWKSDWLKGSSLLHWECLGKDRCFRHLL